MNQWPKQLNSDISEVDEEIVDIIEHEKNRQWKVALVHICKSSVIQACDI